jgi:hypothetical protein
MIYIILTIIYILSVHFISDFIMQSDEMAKGKSTSIKWLTLHILSYLKGFICSAIIFYITITLIWGRITSPLLILAYCLVNAILHWVTDYFTSKETSRLWAELKVHQFFIMIGLDQLIHATCLILTFYLFFLN